MGNIVTLKKSIQIPKSDLIVEQCKITPKVAAEWLSANQKNRPVRKAHVTFLAEQIRLRRWVVNGESIKIAKNEQILDGQHRLLACIEAGESFETIVVYGLETEAFDSVDQGIIRTGADVLALHYPDAPLGVSKAVASGAKYCFHIINGWTTMKAYQRRANFEILMYTNKHPELWRCAEILSSYPKEQRLISRGLGTALYSLFIEKDSDIAKEFMEKFSTGENLMKKDIEYVLRSAFIPDTLRRGSALQPIIKGMMMVKAWNFKRRKKATTTVGSLRMSHDEQPPVIL